MDIRQSEKNLNLIHAISKGERRSPWQTGGKKKYRLCRRLLTSLN
jgi:hypothetical protein